MLHEANAMIAVGLILNKCGTLTHVNDDQYDLQSILNDIGIMTVYYRMEAIYTKRIEESKQAKKFRWMPNERPVR